MYLYKDEEGKICVPAINIKAMIRAVSYTHLTLPTTERV